MIASDRTDCASGSAASLINTHTILLLSGFLFGLCVDNQFEDSIKRLFIVAGMTGLMCYLALCVVKRAQVQTQHRVAILHAEERLERHAHSDSRPLDRVAAAS